MRACFVFYLLTFFFLSAHAQETDGSQRGVASYYGKRFHGKRTASGELFDKEKMTAAHRSLPFGTVVKVTREDNGDFVYVRINDRGPFVRNRVIDLSRKAAAELGIIRRGHQQVVVEVMEGLLSAELPDFQGWQEVENRIAALNVQELDLSKETYYVSPVLKKKIALNELPVKRIPETFIKKVLQGLFPES